MHATAEASLPTWDLDPLYPGLESAEFRAAMELQDHELTALARLFDDLQIRRLAEPPTDAAATGRVLVETLERLGTLILRAERLDCFLQGLVTTDSYNAAAQRELSKLERLDTRRRQLAVRFDGWIGSLGSLLAQVIDKDPLLGEHRFFLEHTVRQSRFLMSEELESLAADLNLDGGSAFGKLQGNVTSQLKIPFERDGKVETLPITVVHNLAYDADAATRERAYRAEIAGWESIRTTVAACLNGVKGTALTLAKRRGRDRVLDVALDQNFIDRATLDAMLGAIRQRLPMFRGYMRAKARRLGVGDQLPWWDLFAPLGTSHARYDWPQARSFIVEHFSRFSDDLGQYAARAFDERWIDAEPRDGKRGGAYCMGIMELEESRILANFDGSYEQISTLAHELGHGYHNHCQRGLKPLLRGSPMTLAETASIFCETLVAEAVLETADAETRLLILDAQVAGATQVCVDISSRFLFEQAVFEARAGSELSADELCAAMLDSQRQTYGDAVVESTYHPYMWLWKPHYYSPDFNFYNFPYAFGHLFGLGLYAEYRRDPSGFVPRYVELLRSTGQDYAAPLAARFGIDITKPEFWLASLDVVGEQAARFAQLP